MEQWSLMLGILVMLVAPLGILLYVAMVVAIPVCRAIDWLFDPRTDEQHADPAPRTATKR